MNSNPFDEQIEAYIDGDLSRRERLAFEQACREDPALRASVEAARLVRQNLRSIEAPLCPPETAQAIRERIRRDHSLSDRSTRPSFAWPAVWKPAAIGLAVLLLALVFVLDRPQPQPVVPPDPEVAEALADVKWTLAFINGVGTRTGETIREEVLRDRVVRPIERGLGIVPRPEYPQ